MLVEAKETDGGEQSTIRDEPGAMEGNHVVKFHFNVEDAPTPSSWEIVILRVHSLWKVRQRLMVGRMSPEGCRAMWSGVGCPWWEASVASFNKKKSKRQALARRSG